MAAKSYYEEHQNLLKESFLYTQEEIKNIRFFQRHVGLFMTLNGSPININKPGMSDAYALLSYKKRFLIHIEIEFKTGKSRLSNDQKKWREFIMSFGGHFLEVRNKEDLLVGVKRIQREINDELRAV